MKNESANLGNLIFDRDILKTVPLFPALTDRQLDTLFISSQHRSYLRQSYILRAEDKPDALYVLLAGRAQVVIEDGDGRDMIISTLGPGAVFGEMSLIDGRPHCASVQALDYCEVLCIARSAFLCCMRENAQAAMLLLGSLVDKLRDADAKIVDLAFTDVAARVARAIDDTARNLNGEWIVEPGAEQIARMVAASREMVSRVLKNFQQNGLIRRHRRKIILVDRVALAQRAAARRQALPPAFRVP